jgi:diaminopimelate decarboxylase
MNSRSIARIARTTSSQQSNYNSRPRPPEVLLDGAAWRVVRARETFEDLVRGETP